MIRFVDGFKDCYSSERISSGTHRVTQNSVGEGVLVIPMPGKRGSGTPFQLVSF
jgi:hypothetical protein